MTNGLRLFLRLIYMSLAVGAALVLNSLALELAIVFAACGAFIVLCELAIEKRVRKQSEQRLVKQNASLEARSDELVAELAMVKRQLAAVAQSFETVNARRDARLVKEMKVIEGLVNRLAKGAPERPEPPPALPEPATRPPDKRSVGPKVGDQPGADLPAAKNDARSAAPSVAELSELELLEVIRSALADNRIELYLQPIVSMPQRMRQYYEGLARLRSLDGDVIEPDQFMGVAERAGLMPIIDNLLLFRCVQIVRRLLKKHDKRPVFCNMSGRSLSDPDFFPQFLEFITENKNLSNNLIFEFSQETITACDREAEANLESLMALGFNFSIDHITNFKLDFSWLRRHNFKFAKLPVPVLVGAHDGAGEIAVDNLLTLFERQGIVPIAERVETEADIVEVLEYPIPLGQGFLFGEPRPIRRNFLDDEDMSAA